jgi:hypothetical protein
MGLKSTLFNNLISILFQASQEEEREPGEFANDNTLRVTISSLAGSRVAGFFLIQYTKMGEI